MSLYPVAIIFMSMILIALAVLVLIGWMSLDKNVFQADTWPAPGCAAKVTSTNGKNTTTDCSTCYPANILGDAKKNYDFFKNYVFWGSIGAGSLGALVLIGMVVSMFRGKAPEAGSYDPAGMQPMDYRQ